MLVSCSACSRREEVFRLTLRLPYLTACLKSRRLGDDAYGRVSPAKKQSLETGPQESAEGVEAGDRKSSSVSELSKIQSPNIPIAVPIGMLNR